MNYTIFSKKLGHEITFSRPGNHYIFVDLSKNQTKPGTLGNQICHGGDIMGSTISYFEENDEVFASICKKWWKKYLKQFNY